MITIATHRYNGALHNTTNNNTNNHTNERTHITTPSSSSSLCEGGGCDHIFLCESICEYVCFFLFCYIKPCFCIVFHVYMCKYLNHLNMQQNSCLSIFFLFEDVFFFSICYFLLSLKKEFCIKINFSVSNRTRPPSVF